MSRLSIPRTYLPEINDYWYSDKEVIQLVSIVKDPLYDGIFYIDYCIVRSNPYTRRIDEKKFAKYDLYTFHRIWKFYIADEV